MNTIINKLIDTTPKGIQAKEDMLDKLNQCLTRYLRGDAWVQELCGEYRISYFQRQLAELVARREIAKTNLAHPRISDVQELIDNNSYDFTKECITAMKHRKTWTGIVMEEYQKLNQALEATKKTQAEYKTLYKEFFNRYNTSPTNMQEEMYDKDLERDIPT